MIEPLEYEDVSSVFHPENIHPQPSTPIVVYLFSHATVDERSPLRELEWKNHEQAIGHCEDTLQEIENLGWIDRSDDTISLTSMGVIMAGPLYAEVKQEIEQ